MHKLCESKSPFLVFFESVISPDEAICIIRNDIIIKKLYSFGRDFVLLQLVGILFVCHRLAVKFAFDLQWNLCYLQLKSLYGQIFDIIVMKESRLCMRKWIFGRRSVKFLLAYHSCSFEICIMCRHAFHSLRLSVQSWPLTLYPSTTCTGFRWSYFIRHKLDKWLYQIHMLLIS